MNECGRERKWQILSRGGLMATRLGELASASAASLVLHLDPRVFTQQHTHSIDTCTEQGRMHPEVV